MKINIKFILMISLIQLWWTQSRDNVDLSSKTYSEINQIIEQIFQTKKKKCFEEGETEWYEDTEEAKIKNFLQKNIDINNVNFSSDIDFIDINKDNGFKVKINQEEVKLLLGFLSTTENIFSFCYKKNYLNERDRESVEYKNNILKDLLKEGFYAEEECIQNKKKIDVYSTDIPRIYNIIYSQAKNINEFPSIDDLEAGILNEDDKEELKEKFNFFNDLFVHCYEYKKKS